MTVLLFSMAPVFTASLLSGFLPALKLLQTDPHAALQQNSNRALGNRQSRHVRGWLIGLQVAGCTVLLLVTALFARSLVRLLGQDKGFKTDHVVLSQVYGLSKRYSTPESRIAWIGTLLNSLRDIPGVQSAGMVSAMPLERETWITGLYRNDERGRTRPWLTFGG